MSGYYEYTHGGSDAYETFEKPCGCSGRIERGMGDTDYIYTHYCDEHKAEQPQPTSPTDPPADT